MCKISPTFSLYVGVVSHGHSSVIGYLNILPQLALLPNVRVLVLDNCSEERLKQLANGVADYIQNPQPLGFGANNNKIFSHIQSLPGYDSDKDWFVVLNPDVAITPEMVTRLIDSLDDRYPICAIDLYKDEAGEVSDDSIRRYPSFIDFVSSLLFGVNRTKLDKTTIAEPCDVDWAAGSFLAIKCSHYEQLGGFDEAYFMYCEDIDICFRSATQFGRRVRYLPHIKARHLAQHGNRKIFSKHFYWHVSSTLRFLWRKSKATQGEGV